MYCSHGVPEKIYVYSARIVCIFIIIIIIMLYSARRYAENLAEHEPPETVIAARSGSISRDESSANFKPFLFTPLPPLSAIPGNTHVIVATLAFRQPILLRFPRSTK